MSRPSALRRPGGDLRREFKRSRVSFANPEVSVVIGEPSSPNHPWGVRRKACKRRNHPPNHVRTNPVFANDLADLKGALAKTGIALPSEQTQHLDYGTDGDGAANAIERHVEREGARKHDFLALATVCLRTAPTTVSLPCRDDCRAEGGMWASALPARGSRSYENRDDDIPLLRGVNLHANGRTTFLPPTSCKWANAVASSGLQSIDAQLNYDILFGTDTPVNPSAICTDDTYKEAEGEGFTTVGALENCALAAVAQDEMNTGVRKESEQAIYTPKSIHQSVDGFSGTFDSDPFGVLPKSCPAREPPLASAAVEVAVRHDPKAPAETISSEPVAMETVSSQRESPGIKKCKQDLEELQSSNAELTAQIEALMSDHAAEADRRDEVERTAKEELLEVQAADKERAARLVVVESELKAWRQRCARLEDAEARACRVAEDERKTNRELLRYLDKAREEVLASTEAERRTRCRADQDAHMHDQTLNRRVELEARLRDALRTLKHKDEELHTLSQEFEVERRMRERIAADLARVSACSANAETNERNARQALNAVAARHAVDLEQRASAHAEACHVAAATQRLQGWLLCAGQVIAEICSPGHLSSAELDRWTDVLGRKFVKRNRLMLARLRSGLSNRHDDLDADRDLVIRMQQQPDTWRTDVLEIMKQLSLSRADLLSELGLNSESCASPVYRPAGNRVSKHQVVTGHTEVSAKSKQLDRGTSKSEGAIVIDNVAQSIGATAAIDIGNHEGWADDIAIHTDDPDLLCPPCRHPCEFQCADISKHVDVAAIGFGSFDRDLDKGGMVYAAAASIPLTSTLLESEFSQCEVIS